MPLSRLERSKFSRTALSVQTLLERGVSCLQSRKADEAHQRRRSTDARFGALLCPVLHSQTNMEDRESGNRFTGGLVSSTALDPGQRIKEKFCPTMCDVRTPRWYSVSLLGAPRAPWMHAKQMHWLRWDPGMTYSRHQYGDRPLSSGERARRTLPFRGFRRCRSYVAAS